MAKRYLLYGSTKIQRIPFVFFMKNLFLALPLCMLNFTIWPSENPITAKLPQAVTNPAVILCFFSWLSSSFYLVIDLLSMFQR